MLQRFNGYFIALLVIVLAGISVVSVLAYVHSTSVISAHRWLGLLALSYGICIFGLGWYRVSQLRSHGLDSYTNQQRKEIQIANTRGRLPFDPALHTAAKSYAVTQRALLRSHVIAFVVWAFGLQLFYLSLSLFMHPNQSGFFNHWMAFGTFYVFFVAINLYKLVHGILKTAQSLGEQIAANEPPPGDNRWWTGRW